MPAYAPIGQLIKTSFAPKSSRFRNPEEARQKARFQTKLTDPSLNDLKLDEQFQISRPAKLIKLAEQEPGPEQITNLSQATYLAIGKISSLLDAAFRKRLDGNKFITKHSSLNDTNDKFTLHASLERTGQLELATLRPEQAQLPGIQDDQDKTKIDLVREENRGQTIYTIKHAGTTGTYDAISCREYKEQASPESQWDNGTEVLTLNYDKRPSPSTGYHRLKLQLGLRNGDIKGKLSNRKLNPQGNETDSKSAFEYEIPNASSLTDTLNLRTSDFVVQT